MKILFTSVGRRVELMQAFKHAAKELGVDLIIIGADITESAPALYFCDETRIVCRIKDTNYIPMLLDICEKDQIDCLIPTIDTDLLLLAENKEKFEAIDTKVLISAVDKVKLCRDKRFTADYFISLGLKSPQPVDDVEKYNMGYPAFMVHDGTFYKVRVGAFKNLDNAVRMEQALKQEGFHTVIVFEKEMR